MISVMSIGRYFKEAGIGSRETEVGNRKLGTGNLKSTLPLVAAIFVFRFQFSVFRLLISGFLKQKVPLCQRQFQRRFAGNQLAIYFHFIGFRIDRYLRCFIIMNKILL